MTSRRTCSVCGSLLDHDRDDRCLKCSSLQRSSDSTVDRTSDEAPTLPPTVSGRESFRATTGSDSHDSNGRFGGYQIRTEITPWTFGKVYDAYHRGLDRQVILRVLENDSSASEETREDFLYRVKVFARINHPNVATTLAAGVDDGDIFVVEEKFDGQKIQGFGPRSFKERIREGFFPGKQLYRIMRDAVVGLQAIHDNGLAHGNINCETILIDANGLVHLCGMHEISQDRLQLESGSKIDESAIRGDLDQLGRTFLRLVAGANCESLLADTGPSTRSLAESIRFQNPGLRTEFCQIIQRCLDQGQADSYSTAQQVIADLKSLLQKRIQRARWRPRIFSLVLSCVGVLIYWSLLPNQLIDWVWVILASLPVFYTVIMETAVGWTVVRRLFGLQLCDVSGQPASWPRRLFRVIAKFGVLLLALMLPACILPLVAAVGGSLAFVVFLVLFLMGPIFILYGASFWIRSRWTFYDLLTGVTWAEEIQQHSVESTTQKSNEQKITRPTDLAPTHSVDQYDIFENLGAGGMGSVFRGRDRTLQRDIAIKVLASHLASHAELLQRFEREARLAANISHPNVAKVFGNGLWHESPYIAMELVEGEDLKATVEKSGSLPIANAWRYITQAAEGLRAADQLGVVHRDIKPANLMIAADDQIKIMDFGISFQTSSDIELTRAGDILGTPVYMSPEQAKGTDVDRRSDIYSLGMTLYFLLSGRQPFAGKNPMQILAQQISDDPDPLTGKVDGLTPDQENLLNRMIAKNPADRYQDYDSLLPDLARAAPGVDRLAKPGKRIAAAICTLVGVLMLFVVITMLVGLAYVSRGEFPDRIATIMFAAIQLLIVIVIVGVYVIGIGFNGMTTGKKLLRLRVKSADGRKASYQQALVRFLVQYPLFLTLPIAGIMGLTPYEFDEKAWLIATNIVWGFNGLLLLISTVMLWKHPQRRTLHDLAAGTIVERIED